MKLPIFKKLVLSGGGIKGLAICGALEEIQEKTKFLESIEIIYGSSIGAYIAFFLCLGISPRNIASIFENVNLVELQEFDMRLFLTKFGFDEGHKFANLLKATIKAQGYDPAITFLELSKISKYKLMICGTNINKSQFVYFSVDSHPDMEIAKALRISGGYPFAFTPVEIDGDLYADGAIVSPLPCDLITEEEKEETLAIAIHKSFNRYSTSNINNYMMSIIFCIIDSLTERNIRSMKHVIEIGYPLNAMSFDIDLDEKKRIVESGKESFGRWILKYEDKNSNV